MTSAKGDFVGGVRLKNGWQVYGMGRKYFEIVQYQVEEYFRNGITVSPDDTVLDIGANIGFFGLEVLRRTQGRCKLVCVEPTSTNTKHLISNIKGNFPQADFESVQAAVSSKEGRSDFFYRPLAPGMSSLDRDVPASKSDYNLVAENQAYESSPYSMPALNIVRKVSKTGLRYLPGLLEKLSNIYVVKESCRVMTLDQIFNECSLAKADLLKIDVEGAELDVLEGLGFENAKKIQKIVIEVHDIENRVKKIDAKLRSLGFQQITVDQELIFKGSSIYNIYALR